MPREGPFACLAEGWGTGLGTVRDSRLLQAFGARWPTPTGTSTVPAEAPVSGPVVSGTAASDASASQAAAAKDDLAGTGATNVMLGGAAALMLVAGTTVFTVVCRRKATNVNGSNKRF